MIKICIIALVGAASALLCSARGVALTVDTPLICQKRIAEAVCLAEPIHNVFKSSKILKRACSDDSARYARPIHRVYQILPKRLQSELCLLDRIFVEKKFWASGYAHPRFRVIGIHRRILDEQRSLSDWATWKERQAFATEQIHTHIAKGAPINLPIVKATGVNGQIDALYYIIAHELAHRIDLANNLTNGGTGQFARLSWRGHGRHVRSTTLPNAWQRPCYYLCRQKKIDLADTREAYQTLLRSNYVSLYSTLSPTEDFAETMVYYLMSERQRLTFEVRVGTSLVLDLSSTRRSELLRPKMEYMKVLLRSP